MISALVFVAASAVAAPEDPWAPVAPTDLPSLRERLVAGDLVSIARGQALLAERGAGTRSTSHGLLDDLSRLMRCLPLGPVPPGEPEAMLAARTLARLERVRLERRLREGLYQGTTLEALVGPNAPVRHEASSPSALWVRWPIESEPWPGETADPRLEPPRCTVGPAPGLEGLDPKVLAEARHRAEGALLAAVAPIAGELPGPVQGAVALAILARRTPADPPIELEEAARVGRLLDAGEAPYRSAGRIILSRALDLAGHGELAAAIYREVFEDPDATAEEDSRARAHAVVVAEPDWRSVLEIARGARAPRPGDVPVLANATARALFSLRDWSQLEAFGRVFVRQRRAPDPVGFDVATEDLLLQLAVERSIPDALRWIEELSSGDRAARFDTVARRALDSGRLDLAAAIYDRLRLETATEAPRRGPSATAELARWTAERALVEYETGDVAAFAGLIDELVRLARSEAHRPLARTAPHRHVARIAQALLGRITNDAGQDDDRRRYAAVLLEAIGPLTAEPTRWRGVLEDHREPLRILAGRFAQAPQTRVASTKDRLQRPKIRSLGEVVVPRLPARLQPIDEPTAVPVIESLLVYEAMDGSFVAGAPWSNGATSPAPSR